MKIGIITDGKYGERAYEKIKQKFDVEWILVPEIPANVMLDDDIDLDIPEKDLYLTYIRHPDFILEIAEMQKPMIIGISPGPGLVRQALEINPRVISPKTMCSLETGTGIPEVDEFCTVFGNPKYKVVTGSSGQVTEITVERSSPCGSSEAGAKYMKDKEINLNNLREFAIRICHECRAPRFGHTCDKEMAGKIHLMAFLEQTGTRDCLASNGDIKEFLDEIQSQIEKLE